jgi:hypothetical protein
MIMQSTSSRPPGRGKQEWRSFAEARAWARSLELKSWKLWRAYITEGDHKNLPTDIPIMPHRAYATEWVSWCDWLGLEATPRLGKSAILRTAEKLPVADWAPAQTKPESGFYTVTPDEAAHLLEKDGPYKPDATSLRIARLLKTDLFPTTHQGLVFDIAGALLSGRELLVAIVIAGREARIKITRGEAPSNARKYGVGRPRNNRDTLKVVLGVAATSPISVLQRAIISGAFSADPNDRVLTIDVFKALSSELGDVASWAKPDGDRGLWQSWARAAVVFAMSVPGIKGKARTVGRQLVGVDSALAAVSRLRAELRAEEPKQSARAMFQKTVCGVANLCCPDDPPRAWNDLLSSATDARSLSQHLPSRVAA